MTLVSDGTRHVEITAADTPSATKCASGGEPLQLERWGALATSVLHAERVAGGELGLTFVSPSEMATLNHKHMGVDRPTDVLAFPLDANTQAAEHRGPQPEVAALLGDVVVCPQQARIQAATHKSDHHDGTFEDELALLVVHGVLHVLGYDHADATEAVAMQAREQELLDAHYRSWTCSPTAGVISS